MTLAAPRRLRLVLVLAAVAAFVMTAGPATTLGLVRPELGLDERIAERLVALIDDQARFRIFIELTNSSIADLAAQDVRRS